MEDSGNPAAAAAAAPNQTQTTSDDDSGQQNDWRHLTDRQAFLFKLFLFVIGCSSITILGIVTNIINIVVFVKQGAYKEHGSVNLLGLAVIDLFVVVCGLYKSVLYGITILDPPGLSWVPYDVMYITSSWPHVMFGQMTRCVTAYIAFERCVCVVFPFKVKMMFTPTRSIVVISGIFVAFWCSYSPVFIEQQLKYIKHPVTNVTKLTLVSSANWLVVVDAMWAVNSILFNQGSVVIVLVCTIITVSRVKLSKSWRDSVSTGGQKTTSSSTTSSHPPPPPPSPPPPPAASSRDSSKLQKEKRLIAMISLICFIFLICYLPDLIFMLIYATNPDVRVAGKYDNLAWSIYGFIYFMQDVNSSINIFVYHRMSSRYKQVFRQLFGTDKGGN